MARTWYELMYRQCLFLLIRRTGCCPSLVSGVVAEALPDLLLADFLDFFFFFFFCAVPAPPRMSSALSSMGEPSPENKDVGVSDRLISSESGDSGGLDDE